jgi:hypothetical protein
MAARRHLVFVPLAGLLILGFGLQGCVATAVAGATLHVAGAAVGTAAKVGGAVVGTTVKVGSGAVHATASAVGRAVKGPGPAPN